MLDTKTPTEPLFRLGRKPDPWTPPDCSRAQPHGTFGTRFDDPQGDDGLRGTVGRRTRLGPQVIRLRRSDGAGAIKAKVEQVKAARIFITANYESARQIPAQERDPPSPLESSNDPSRSRRPSRRNPSWQPHPRNHR